MHNVPLGMTVTVLIIEELMENLNEVAKASWPDI